MVMPPDMPASQRTRPKEPPMTLSSTLDIQQGCAFTPGSHAAVGHLVMATILGAALTADLTVTDPVTNANMPAAGVLAEVHWGETPGAPLSMTAYVSERNRTVLQQLQQQQITNTAVILDFRVYQYDAGARVYYGSFAPKQPPLDALIGKSGSNTIELQVSSTPRQVKAIVLYEVTMTVQPAPQLQELAVAASASVAIIKAWGG
jgi:hypothetical protein